MISILVPVYNAESYLNRCIDSILAQTFRDFELVLLNDGSTDGSGAICEQYASADSRVRVICSENCGVGAARNLLIENARGEYIGFIDSDDYIEPDMFEELYANLIATGAGISLCGTRFVFPGKTQSNSSGSGEMKVLPKREAIFLLIDNWMITCGPCDKLYRTELFKDVTFPEVAAFEDMLTAFRIFEKCEKISYVDKLLYNYVKTPDSILRSKFCVDHLAELDARKMMTKQIGAVYPDMIPKLKMNELKTQLYICNRIIFESPEMKDLYKKMSSEIKANYKEIIRSEYADKKFKTMAALMKINGWVYKVSVKIMKNILHKGIQDS